MIRHALAGVLAIIVIPAALRAQTLTIEAASADVYELPAVTARVIGQVRHGRVLDVAREDGDWVMVVWPEAKAGVGYVRLRIGSVATSDRIDDVRADVEAVERAIVAICAARSHAAPALHDEPSR